MKIDELVESPQTDAAYRKRAMRAYHDLLRAVERIGGLSGMVKHTGAYIARKEVLRHPEGFGLVVWEKSPGTPLGAANVDKRILVLYLDRSKDIIPQMQSSQVRLTIIHELIHLFDSERMKVMNPSAGSSDKEYFNNPMETNAFYQEAISKFEDTVRRLSPKAKENMFKVWSQSFDRWYDTMHLMFTSGFSSNLDIKNNKKLMRRLYQYWDANIKGVEA